MRRALAALFLGCMSLVTLVWPAAACDPDWDWCGYDWYAEPAYEEPAWSWSSWWWEPDPVYVPDPVVTYTPVADDPPSSWSAPAYDPAPLYQPAPLYEPAPWNEPAPIYSPPADPAEQSFVPSSSAPVTSWPEPVVWASPGADVLDAAAEPSPPAPVPAPPPDRTAQAAELGLHLVTDVYAGNNVITVGLTTTYTASTVQMSAGTAAQKVASVGTGEASAYDALLWNGRMSLSDGRPVAGSIYANYFWDGWEWSFDKYVFFQDDLETARLALPPATSAPPITVVVPPAAPPIPTAAPPAAVTPTIPEAGPAFVVPLIEDGPGPVGPPGPAVAPESSPAMTEPRVHDVRAGVALAPQGDALGHVEVLRGRRVRLWMRGTVDGLPARVLGWRVLSSELTALGPVSGGGDDPLMAAWESISPSGTAFTLRISVTVQVPDGSARDAIAAIDVVVRSPALVQ